MLAIAVAQVWSVSVGCQAEAEQQQNRVASRCLHSMLPVVGASGQRISLYHDG